MREVELFGDELTVAAKVLPMAAPDYPDENLPARAHLLDNRIQLVSAERSLWQSSGLGTPGQAPRLAPSEVCAGVAEQGVDAARCSA